MTFAHGSRQRIQAIACLLLALGLPVLGNRTAVAYLNAFSADVANGQSLGNSQVECRDTKPKPTRQQLRVTVDKGTAFRAAFRRSFLRQMEDLHAAAAVGAPVRGQHSIGIAKVKGATPDYMKVHDSPHPSLAPPG